MDDIENAKITEFKIIQGVWGNGENKILISEGVVKQDGTIGSPKNIEVVMPLTGGFKGNTMIDLAIMKQYKRKIVLRMKDNDNKPVYVEEIK